jgi:hypothetical protein
MSITMQHTIEKHVYGTPELENMAPAVSPMYVTETDIDEGRLLRRIDFRVMPMLFLIYVAAFLDR